MGIKSILDQLKPYAPKKVILFGSQAYGTPHENSDYDVAIVKNTPIPFHDRLIQVRRLVRTTQPIDFFVFTEAEIASHKKNPFIAEIFNKGKVVYEQP